MGVETYDVPIGISVDQHQDKRSAVLEGHVLGQCCDSLLRESETCLFLQSLFLASTLVLASRQRHP